MPLDTNIGYSYRWAVAASFDIYQVVTIENNKIDIKIVYDLIGDPVIVLQYCETSRFSYDESFYESFGVHKLSNEDCARLCSITGSGTDEDPYLLSKSTDFFAMRLLPNSNFKLYNDIDFKDRDISDPYPRGVYNGVSSFNGVLDGDGKSVLKLQMFPGTNLNRIGLIGTLGENGIVKNIIFDNVHIFSMLDENENVDLYIAGIVCGYSNGQIINCCVNNSEIHLESNKNKGNHAIYAGGVCGVNKGHISSCIVDGSVLNVVADISTTNSSGYNNVRATAGGIAGLIICNDLYEYSISDCQSNNNKITTLAIWYANGVDDITASSGAYSGGRVGQWTNSSMGHNNSNSNCTFKATEKTLRGWPYSNEERDGTIYDYGWGFITEYPI